MFRVQIWDEYVKRYVDVALSFDQSGAIGLRLVGLCDTPEEYVNPYEAWLHIDDLQERFAVADIILLDISTGDRYRNDCGLPGVDDDLDEASIASDSWTNDWIIQRAVGIWSAGDGGVYAPWPEYPHPMTRDQALMALEECDRRWPQYGFRAHRLSPEEKLAVDTIDRVRRSTHKRKNN